MIHIPEPYRGGILRRGGVDAVPTGLDSAAWLWRSYKDVVPLGLGTAAHRCSSSLNRLSSLSRAVEGDRQDALSWGNGKRDARPSSLDIFVGYLIGHFVAGNSYRFPYTCSFSWASIRLAIFDEVTEKVNEPRRLQKCSNPRDRQDACPTQRLHSAGVQSMLDVRQLQVPQTFGADVK